MTLQVDIEKILPIGDSADTLIAQGGAGFRLNPSVTPWKFDAADRARVRMTSFDGTPVGEFIGLGAEENATRLCAMLRLCDGAGTDVLHRLRGKLSEILDTEKFPSAKKMLTSRAYTLVSGERKVPCNVCGNPTDCNDSLHGVPLCMHSQEEREAHAKEAT